MPLTPRRPLLLGVALAALTALVALGCTSEDERLTAEQATALVEAGLVTEEDLPSTVWEVTEGSPDDGEAGDEPDDMFAGTEACQDLEAAIEAFAVSEGEDSPPLAEGERSFDAGGDSLVLRSVQTSVIVPAEPAEVEQGFEALREVFNVETLRPCFEEAFMEGFMSDGGDAEGVAVTELAVTEPDTVIEGGVGITLQMEAAAFIIPIALHLEIHMWPEGPAVGSLMFMEMNSELLQENSADMLEAAHTRLASAVRANP
jgi:hypothetical protein